MGKKKKIHAVRKRGITILVVFAAVLAIIMLGQSQDLTHAQSTAPLCNGQPCPTAITGLSPSQQVPSPACLGTNCPTVNPSQNPAGGNKINICHRTGNNRWIPLQIGANAFDGHNRHGDFIYRGPVNPQNQRPSNANWCTQNNPSSGSTASGSGSMGSPISPCLPGQPVATPNGNGQGKGRGGLLGQLLALMGTLLGNMSSPNNPCAPQLPGQPGSAGTQTPPTATPTPQ